MIIGEDKKAYNRAYYAARKERLSAEALARYHAGGKDRIDRVVLAAYCKQWRAENPEKAKRTQEQEVQHQLRFKERYEKPEFRARFLARQKRYAQAHPLMIRKTNLKKKYGLSIEDYDKMIVAQDGKCAICGKSSRVGKDLRSFLHVDHCHDPARPLFCFWDIGYSDYTAMLMTRIGFGGRQITWSVIKKFDKRPVGTISEIGPDVRGYCA